ncbi:MAG: 2-amino-4-hydroxy-6-hydroxymethyldihydropteridine diphosphokinase [Gammaproteobacteria bacterium]|nr:2-amino-4-hydroxy-6-hydroxymethyldihydropteridine diphosphokinase [Gammaproteobacteria bacterium]
MTKVVRAYVALGSNLADPMVQVRAGIDALAALPETTVVRNSSLYRTAPVGVTAQPDFINAVSAIDTSLTPERLMQALLATEQAHGRVRSMPGGPRTLDLDLLLYADLQLQSTLVTVPHPRLHERAFVLYPLAEIAPNLQVPGRGDIAELVRRCADQTIERLPA